MSPENEVHSNDQEEINVSVVVQSDGVENLQLKPALAICET
jgi:hypothetical protein